MLFFLFTYFRCKIASGAFVELERSLYGKFNNSPIGLALKECFMFEEYHASKNATDYLQQQIMGKTFCLIVGSNPDGTKPMTIKLVFAASPISTKCT